jgi:translation initiation factor 3 subunit B
MFASIETASNFRSDLPRTQAELEAETEALYNDGYFSDNSLDLDPKYPMLKTTFEASIVVLNLPKVPQAKVEKLTKVVKKIVSRLGVIATTEGGFDGFLMPFNDEKASTEGFAIIEYETPEEAKNAISVLDGYKFDKNHSLVVTPYSRSQKLQALEETEFVAPERPPFVEKPNAMSWLEDPSQRDEYVIRQGKETVVSWFDGKVEPVVDYDGAREKEAGVNWCEYYCHWSPKGSYLATLVPARGVILWSGDTYEKVARFVAADVKTVLFSPEENYMLTNNMRYDDDQAIKVYHIQSGKLLRTFPLYPDNIPRSDDHPPPPFQWSHDDAYLARMGKDLVSIYSTPSMRLLDKKSLLAEGIHEFQWSPKANVLALWVSCYYFYTAWNSIFMFSESIGVDGCVEHDFCSTTKFAITSQFFHSNTILRYLNLISVPGTKKLSRSRRSHRTPQPKEASTKESLQRH